MAVFTQSINRFNFGEVSPLVAERTDLARFGAGCRRLENFLPRLQGPAAKRPGTRLVALAASKAKPAALLPFVFSADTSYVIEMGDRYMRFYCGGRPVLKDPAAARPAPYVLRTDVGLGQIFDSAGRCQVKTCQSGDVMYLAAPGMAPKKLSRLAHNEWELADLPGWGGRPNPGAVALFRERLCLAAGATLYLSQSGAFENFELTAGGEAPVAADDPMEISVYSEQVNRVAWLLAGDRLLVGTSGGEFSVGEVTSVEPLGPGNVKAAPLSAYGSSCLQAVRVGGRAIFAQRSGRKVRAYSLDDGAPSAPDLTVAAEHVTAGGVIAMAWQGEPCETLWLARADGCLVGLTYCPDEDMLSWHRHWLGGGGEVVSLCVVPATFGGGDELWLAVRRLVRDAYQYSVERLEEGLYADAAVTAEGEALAEVAGLNHLEGLTAAIVADGVPLPPQRVTAYRVALPAPAREVTVGLAYTSVLTTLPARALAAAKAGVSEGRQPARAVSAALRLIGSGGGEAGPAASPQPLEYGGEGLFSGEVRLSWPGGYEEGPEATCVTVAQAEPLPFTLAAIRLEMTV